MNRRPVYLHRLSSGDSQVDTFHGILDGFTQVPNGNIAVTKEYVSPGSMDHDRL